tara:strand:+ start:225 stop:875 length:651 start_codon:yes stop_codon:yes gene_type:complete
MSENLEIVSHPVVQHKLGLLRKVETTSPEFRLIVQQLSPLLAYEACRDWFIQEEKEVQTPMEEFAKARFIADWPVLVSIMRAGNGMLDPILSLFSSSAAGHIGIYRDKFIKNTVEYYFRLPDNVQDKNILLLDPLVATADTVIASIDRLKQYDVGEIRMLTLLISKLGVSKIKSFHPDVKIFAAGCQEGLDSNGYLVPGLGDAGDRLYQINNGKHL